MKFEKNEESTLKIPNYPVAHLEVTFFAPHLFKKKHTKKHMNTNQSVLSVFRCVRNKSKPALHKTKLHLS